MCESAANGDAGSGAAASGRGPETLAITWAGNPWDLVGLSFKNFLLTVITLGIYSFWGKTEVRKRIWSSVRIQGEPLNIGSHPLRP